MIMRVAIDCKSLAELGSERDEPPEPGVAELVAFDPAPDRPPGSTRCHGGLPGTLTGLECAATNPVMFTKLGRASAYVGDLATPSVCDGLVAYTIAVSGR
jgi:hypothetical protein